MIKIETKCRKIKLEDGTEFFSYKAFTKKGWTNLKFTKDCENVPVEPSFIYVEKEDVNVSYKEKYPVVWVRKIVKVERIDFEQKVADYFDTETK